MCCALSIIPRKEKGDLSYQPKKVGDKRTSGQHGTQEVHIVVDNVLLLGLHMEGAGLLCLQAISAGLPWTKRDARIGDLAVHTFTAARRADGAASARREDLKRRGKGSMVC